MIRRRPLDIGSTETETLNLTPFLDVMMVLIPFLMLSASFTTVVVNTVRLPAPVASTRDVPRTPPFDLVVQMPKDSIKVFLNPQGSADRPLLSLPVPPGEGVDPATLGRLHRALVEIKKSHPGETRIALDPAGTTSMERMQQVMDNLALHSREDGPMAGKPLFPDIALKGVYAP
jgi:biopolymer transport protein ExbD